MRLRRLELEKYGSFAAQCVTLDAAPGRLNLVIAPNGAGKSVLRQAISDLLFGIRQRSAMGFAFDYGSMRLRADAVFPDGREIGFVRRKGLSNTLSGPDGEPADPSLPGRLPREADRKRLERLFVLDSASLREGGDLLLQSDGDLAEALLSSAGEMRPARALAADLARRRDDAAPRRKGNAPFYRALDEWTGAGKLLAETTVKPATIAAHEEERAAAERDRDGAQARHQAARDALSRLARIRATRHHLRAIDDAAAWLAAHPEAPALPAGAGPALQAAREARDAAAREAATASDLLQRLEAQLAASTLDAPALAQAAGIDALTAARTQSEQSRADIPARQHEQAEAEAAIALLLRQIASPATPAEAAAEIRPAAAIAAARALIAGSAELTAAAAAARDRAEREREAVAAAEDDLAALPPAAETDTLRAARDEAVADGEPFRLRRAAQERAAAATAAATSALARLPAALRDPAAAAPTAPALDRLADALATARAALATASGRREDAAAALAEARARLAQLTAGGPLPDEAAIAAARAHRDRGTALLFARLDGRPDPAEPGWTGGAPLQTAFAAAIAGADTLADRRAAESGRLALAGEHAAAIRRAEAALAEAAAHAAADADRARLAEAGWAAAIGPLGLDPAAPLAEARAVLAAREAALDALAEADAATAAEAALAAHHARLAAELAAALATPPDTLPRLALVAEARLKEADRVAGQRQNAHRALIATRRTLANALPKLEAAEARLAAWSARWAAAQDALGLPGDTAPAEAAALLDRLVQLPEKVAAEATARTRLAAMREQLAAFERQAAAIAAALGEPQDDALALAARLAARLKAARAAATARDTLTAERVQAQGRHAAADTALALAARALEDTIRATGAATFPEAEARVALAAGRAAHEQALDGARLKLREDGEGLDEQTLREDAAAIPPGELDTAKREADDEAAAANAAAQRAAARIERAEGEMRALAGRDHAPRAAATRHAAAARLGRLLDDALVQHLAAAMLEHGLAEVEAMGSRNALLARLGAAFQCLTGGAYDRLSPAAEEREGDAHGRLVAHAPGSRETHIARLSEGTRDQLYLAMRLVAVEDHVRAGPALPFVADDLLQTFDDSRARAAMEALIRLSQQVQVIVLTHHPHLASVAEGLPVHLARL